MFELPASPWQATWLGWIPLPAVVLAGDGSAVAVNERWADLSPVPGDGQGWLEAVEPAFRPALRATLLIAATTAHPGSADCPVTGPRGGRRSRWWWQPIAPGDLVVCVAVIDGDPAERSPMPGDARDPLAREQTRAAPPAGISAELAMAAVHRIFQAGLALESAASLLPGGTATQILGAVDDLDRLVRDIRDAVLNPPDRRTDPPPHEAQSGAGIPASAAPTPQPAEHAGDLLDSVVNGIFTAGMSLQSAMGLPLPETAAQHITEAVRHLDEVIRHVRDHILTGHGQQAHARERAERAANHPAVLRERGDALRERLLETARALNLAAADAAALLEQRAGLLDQPGRIDYPTEIKRWRVFADQAKQMAERYEHL